MDYSQITITFNTDLIEDRGLGFKTVATGPSLFNREFDFRWVNVRSGSGQVPIGLDTPVPGEISATFFAKSFNIDFNSSDIFKVERTENVVVIKCTIPGVNFQNAYSADNYSSDPLVLNNEVTFNIENDVATVYEVTDLQILEATENPTCTHYKVSIETSVLTDSVYGTVLIPTGNTDNPFTFELPRGQGFRIGALTEDAQATELLNQIIIRRSASEVPGVLNSSTVNLEILSSPSGTTVTVLSEQISGLVLEYSLDNLSWQQSNVFPGILDGDYNLFVRDNFGCSFQQDFTVDGNNIVDPYLYISKSMSLRFARRVNFSNCGPYKIDDNTLSSEAFAADECLAYTEVQQLQTCDVITTQIKSNFDQLSAKVIKENGDEVVVPIFQKTNFIGLKDARDAILYDVGQGQTGIYFTSGNIYNFDTEIDTGEDHNLNGFLPEWGYYVGNFVNVSGSWHEIKSIIYDESIESEVVIIDSVFSGGSPVTALVKSEFNRQKYDVFEFSIDMSAYEDQIIQVSVEATDANFENVSFLSEKIFIKERHEDTVEIKYRNNFNGDVFYKTGITNIIRLPIAYIGGDHDDEGTENSKGDERSTLISSLVYELNEFEFEPVTKEIYWKLIVALSHKFVSIDGVSYIKDGNIEKEGPLEDSNLYVVRARMLKTQAPYNSNVVGIETQIVDTDQTLEVPNLILSDNDSFIAYNE